MRTATHSCHVFTGGSFDHSVLPGLFRCNKIDGWYLHHRENGENGDNSDGDSESCIERLDRIKHEVEFLGPAQQK